MIIRRINITNFGKLKNFSLDLGSDINVIFGENESGKSTLMSFVHMMFYAPHTRSSDISLNLRKKYEPWDGSPSGGSLEFEHGGRKYRLEKVFGKTARTDKTMLMDLLSGEDLTPADSTTIGRDFFGMGEEAFQRSLFIGQAKSLIEKSSTDGSEIINRLQNLVSSGDEEQSYPVVSENLSKAYQTFHALRGRKGLVDQISDEITSLEEAKLLAAEDEKEKEVLLDDYRLLEEEKTGLTASLATLDAAIKTAEKNLELLQANEILKLDKEVKTLAEQIESLSAELTKDDKLLTLDDLSVMKEVLTDLSKSETLAEERKTGLEKIEADLKAAREGIAKLPDAAELAKISQEQTGLEEAGQKLNDLKYRDITLASDITEAENRLRDSRALSGKGKIHKILSLILFVAAFAGLALGYFTDNLLYGVIGTGALALVALILLLLAPRRSSGDGATGDDLKTLENQVTSLKDEREQVLGEIKKLSEVSGKSKEAMDAFISKYELAGHHEISHLSYRLKSLQDKQGSLEEDLERQKNEAEKLQKKQAENHDFIFRNHVAYFEGMSSGQAQGFLDKLRDKVNQLAFEKTKLEERKNRLKRLLGGRSLEEIKVPSESELDETAPEKQSEVSLKELLVGKRNKKDELQKQINDLDSRLLAIRKDMEHKFKDRPEMSALEEDLYDARTRLKEATRLASSVKLAQKIMEESFEHMQSSFAPIVNSKTGHIFSALTKGAYKDLSVSKDFDVLVKDVRADKMANWEYLSAGAADQLYFSLRMAISEIFSEDLGGLPIFLDDPFVQYDDERRFAALNFLREYSKEKNSQIILFTCHKAVLDLCRDFKIVKI